MGGGPGSLGPMADDPLDPDGASPAAAPAGRTCAEAACATRLSRYNHGPYCSLHEPPSAPRVRGLKLDVA